MAPGAEDAAVLAAVLALGVAAGDALGPPVRLDEYQFRPPKAFHVVRMDLFHGTRAGTIGPASDAARFLSTALVDGDGEDAASMLVSVIEAGFSLDHSARDELATASARHFRDELGLRFSLDRADLLHGRVEVLGSIREGSQLRQVLVAAWPGEARHVVVVASVPSGRWNELKAALRESLASMRPEGPLQAGPPRPWRWAFLALVGALLVTSLGLWRRRRAARAEGG